MLSRNSIHSFIQGEILPLIKAEIKSKIQHIESCALLRKSVSHLKYLDSLARDNGKVKSSPLELTAKELFGNELEDTAEADTEIEDVKRLESWTYAKGLHKKNDNDFRRTLRTTTMKKVAAIKLDNCMDDHDSYIIKIASQQLKRRQIMGSEAISERASKGNSIVYSKIPDTYLRVEGKGSKNAQNQSTGNSLDNEIRTELEALTYRRYIQEKKEYLKKLIADNDSLVREMNSMRLVMIYYNELEIEWAT